MSQYPHPPLPYAPPPGWPVVAPARAEARAAGRWQMLLAGLLLLGGTCVGTLVTVIPDSVLSAQMEQQQTPVLEIPGRTPIQSLRLFLGMFGGLAFLVGVVLLVLAIFVRRGGRASIIVCIVVDGAIGLMLLLSLGSAAMAATANPMGAALAFVMYAALLGLCVTAITKLVSAYRAAGVSGTTMAPPAYWMMMPQQSGSVGYGYGYPAPPPGAGPVGPLSPPLPPPSNQPPPPGGAGSPPGSG